MCLPMKEILALSVVGDDEEADQDCTHAVDGSLWWMRIFQEKFS